jgi:DNA-binding CsgD family transcriptional regulator
VTSRPRETYHFDGGLEQAIVDLVRVGSAGHASGVRQLATRLVRSVPPSVGDPVKFRVALREAIAPSPAEGLRFGAGELPTDQGGTDDLVSVDASPDGTGLVLEPQTMEELQEVVEERYRAKELDAAGLSLTRTVLFSGPPGVGKSMAAQWLAREIGVPLVSVNLASLVSSYLGSSGRNVRSVLEYAKTGKCVMLLDEFDAIAKRRNDESDIGELKRIVNVILLELDRWPDDNLLVAATNHLQLLDEAVDRRFDRHIVFRLPGEVQRRAILDYHASGTDVENDGVIQLIVEMTPGWSGSDLKRLWELGMRRAVLNGSPGGEQLLRTLAQRVSTPRRERDLLWLALSERLELSSRQIASLTGVSHPTVSAGIRRARGDSKT